MTDILNTLVTQADTPAGTYVGANLDPFTDEHRALLKAVSGLSGSKVGAEKLHTTVIYSMQYVEPAKLEPLLKLYKAPLLAKIVGAAAFDALPSPDGTRADDVATLVLKLECPELMELHAGCKQLGCTHTYPELSPHVSLFYGVPRVDCRGAVDTLNALIAKLEQPLYVQVNKLYAEPIKQDWAVKNTSKR